MSSSQTTQAVQCAAPLSGSTSPKGSLPILRPASRRLTSGIPASSRTRTTDSSSIVDVVLVIGVLVILLKTWKPAGAPDGRRHVHRVTERRRTRSRNRPGAGASEQEIDVRFSYANERTFLAWNRTALALIATGVAATQLLPKFDVTFGRRLLGLPLIALGALHRAHQLLALAGERTGDAAW